MSPRLILAVLATAIYALVASPAKAELVVCGGTPTQQAMVQHLYHTLPACCRTCNVCVHLMNNQAMDTFLRLAEGSRAYLYNNRAIDGVFQNSTTTVTLRVASPDIDISATFGHEYGHFVWSRVLSRNQRREYEDVYKIQAAAHHLITKYAAQSVEEGFAEAYSYYIRQPHCLKNCDPLSCESLKRLIGDSLADKSEAESPSL